MGKHTDDRETLGPLLADALKPYMLDAVDVRDLYDVSAWDWGYLNSERLFTDYSIAASSDNEAKLKGLVSAVLTAHGPNGVLNVLIKPRNVSLESAELRLRNKYYDSTRTQLPSTNISAREYKMRLI